MEAAQPDVAPVVEQGHVDLLLAHLDFTNTPKGLAKAYQEDTKAERTCTEKLFLDAGGFSAWFAHFLAKRAAKSAVHFDGQAACNQMLKAVDGIPTESRQLLAREVREAIPPAVQTKFQDVFNKAIKPIQTDLIGTSRKRRRIAEGNGSPLATTVQNFTAPVNNAYMYTNTSQSATHFNLGNPPVLRVATVLPLYTAGAIRRSQSNDGTWTAAIAMSFLDASSFGHKLGCMMSLEVTNNKVERLASELFDAHIESTDEHRYLILPSGLRVIPSPDLILRGCKRHKILDWLGCDIEKAIKTSPAFQEEAEQGNPLTECVTMTISHQAMEGAIINLSLDEKEGVRIRRKLYE